MFNIFRNRELLLARVRREATYFMSDVVAPSGAQPIQPFVVICRQRTGSNMLRYALETHPQVVQYGEIFRQDRIWGAHGKYACRPMSLVDLRNQNAPAFINDVLFRDARAPIRAVGFKLFYWHGRNSASGNPWPVLRERTDLKVVHLIRQNPIGAFMSTQRTLRDATYVQMKKAGASGEDKVAKRTITVDIPRFREYITEYEEFVQRLERELGARATLELSYEDLAAHTDREIARVLDFIGVDPMPLRTQTERQSRGKLIDQIVNLDEVAAAHRDTRWANVPARWS